MLDGAPTTLQIPEHLRVSFEDDETLPTLLSIARGGIRDSKVTRSPRSSRRLAMSIATRQAAIRENAAKEYLGEKPKHSNSPAASQERSGSQQCSDAPCNLRAIRLARYYKESDKPLPFPDVLSTTDSRNLPFPDVCIRGSRDREDGAIERKNLPFPEAGCSARRSRLPFPEAGLPAERGRPRTTDQEFDSYQLLHL